MPSQPSMRAANSGTRHIHNGSTLPGSLNLLQISCAVADSRSSSSLIDILRTSPKLLPNTSRASRVAWSCTFSPGYASELNPDEFVWNHLRQQGVSKTPLRQDESLRKRVESDLAEVKSRPKLVRSFFRAVSVAYTAD